MQLSGSKANLKLPFATLSHHCLNNAVIRAEKWWARITFTTALMRVYVLLNRAFSYLRLWLYYKYFEDKSILFVVENDKYNTSRVWKSPRRYSRKKHVHRGIRRAFLCGTHVTSIILDYGKRVYRNDPHPHSKTYSILFASSAIL